jgi:hypothetical protein
MSFKTIINIIVNRNLGPAVDVINSVYTELDFEDNAAFSTTQIDFQDVEACLLALKEGDASKTLTIGQTTKLRNLVRLINDGKAPSAYPPVTQEWVDAFTSNNSVNINGPPPPPQPVQTKLDKSPVSIDGFIVDKSLTPIEQAHSLITIVKAWAAPQLPTGGQIVSTKRSQDGNFLDVQVETTGLEEQLNRNLHAALTTIIHNSSCLKDRIPDAPTGRELWLNLINVLIPPNETQRNALVLQTKLAALKYEDFDTPEELLAARNAVLRHLTEFGREATTETKYFTLLGAIPQEPTFFNLLIEYQHLLPTTEAYRKLESNFLEWARLAPKEKASTTAAVRAAAKRADDEHVNEITRRIHALENSRFKKQGGGGKKGGQAQGQSKPRGDTFIPHELYTSEVKKELDDLLGNRYEEIRAIKLKYNKSKGFSTEEAKGTQKPIKGTQAVPDVRTAHRLCVRPSTTTTASPITAFTASKVFDKIPDEQYDEGGYEF